MQGGITRRVNLGSGALHVWSPGGGGGGAERRGERARGGEGGSGAVAKSTEQPRRGYVFRMAL